jgi:hypothetical protein
MQAWHFLDDSLSYERACVVIDCGPESNSRTRRNPVDAIAPVFLLSCYINGLPNHDEVSAVFLRKRCSWFTITARQVARLSKIISQDQIDGQA